MGKSLKEKKDNSNNKPKNSKKQQQNNSGPISNKYFAFLGVITSIILYVLFIKNDSDILSEKKIVLINTDRKVESQIIKNYFKSKSNEYKVVHRYTQQRHSKNYYLQWSHFHWDVNYQSGFNKSSQIVSHMQGAEDLYDNKNQMVQNLINYDKKTDLGIKSTDFLPVTYTWDISTTRVSKEEKELFAIKNNKDKWIVKNPVGMGGKGIKIIDDIQSYAQQIKRAKQQRTNDPEFNRFKQAQLYIKNPLLLNGRKAEYRAYVLIACTDPLLIVFNKGFIKSALRKYDYNSSDLKSHLTNLAEARKNEDEYNKMKNDAYLNVEQFENMLKNDLNKSQQEIDQFYQKLAQLVGYTMMAGKNKIKRQPGTFETFAIDILLDDQLKPYLLEINQPYAVEGALLPGYKDVLPDFYNGSLDLVLQLHEQRENIKETMQNPEKLKLGKNMQIIYNEATGYNFLEELAKQQQQN